MAPSVKQPLYILVLFGSCGHSAMCSLSPPPPGRSTLHCINKTNKLVYSLLSATGAVVLRRPSSSCPCPLVWLEFLVSVLRNACFSSTRSSVSTRGIRVKLARVKWTTSGQDFQNKNGRARKRYFQRT